MKKAGDMSKVENMPLQTVGLRFFNVYGPNEYHKGTMASMVYHGYNQFREQGLVKLYKSYNKRYSDGGQLRDFVYVKDICSVVRFFLEHKEFSGLYNVGTSVASSFNELISAICEALNIENAVSYIEMPSDLKNSYQYYTKANIDKLVNTGYRVPFYSLKEGVRDYVLMYLENDFKIYLSQISCATLLKRTQEMKY